MVDDGDELEYARLCLKGYFDGFSADQVAPHLATMVVRPTDVFIATRMKSGTTWLQQIVHQLRSGGDESFVEIDAVVPWVPFAHTNLEAALDLNADQPWSPRAFKFHSYYENLPPLGSKARYIFCTRDCADACFSSYKFHHDIYNPQREERTISPDVFFTAFLDDYSHPNSAFAIRHVMWKMIASWYPHRNDPNVLWIHYEDLKEDLEFCIRKVAAFIGIENPPADLIELVNERSSYKYMVEHHKQFDGSFSSQKMMYKLLGHLQTDDFWKGRVGKVGKVRKDGGTSGAGAKGYRRETLQRMQEIWDEVVLPVTGCRDYAELRRQMTILGK